MSSIDVGWARTRAYQAGIAVTPDYRGLSATEWNRLRDRLEQQTWTKGDVQRLQERVRRIAKKGEKRG